MKVLVHTILIDRDMVTKISKQVWAWETPVIETKFEEGRVRVLEESEIEIEALPEVKDELARLKNTHGYDGQVSYCEMAYGRGKAGEAELAKAMKAKPKKTSKAKPKKAEKADEGDGDPLDL